MFRTGSSSPRNDKKAHRSRWAKSSGANQSDCTVDLAGTQAAGAGVHTSGSTVDNSLDTSYVGLPGTIGTAMRVGYLDSKSNTLAADFTLCHYTVPPLHGAFVFSCNSRILPQLSHNCNSYFHFVVLKDLLPNQSDGFLLISPKIKIL